MMHCMVVLVRSFFALQCRIPLSTTHFTANSNPTIPSAMLVLVPVVFPGPSAAVNSSRGARGNTGRIMLPVRSLMMSAHPTPEQTHAHAHARTSTSTSTSASASQTMVAPDIAPSTAS